MFNFIFPKFYFHIEKWKWNSEFRIFVSSYGHFKDEYKNNIPIKINDSGYVSIETPYGRKLAHRLVMLTFKPIPNAESLTVDHLDHNKRNNSVENLEWVSRNENQKRAKQDLIPDYKVTEGKIYNGLGLTFSTYEDAATWLINYLNLNNLESKPNPNNIAKRIKKAASTGTNYYNIIWSENI